MKAFSDLRLFFRAARCTSLSEAARSLDLTPASASAAIQRLEDEIGVPLFVRSTRSLRLTPQGEQFLSTCEPALDTIVSAVEELEVGQNALSGTVNLAMPSDLGRNVVLGWIAEFQRLNPGVHVKVHISDHLVGMYRDQVDVALRYGACPDSSLIALPLASSNRRVLCAAPSYIEKHGAPLTPGALVEHNCLCFMLGDRMHNRWSFRRGEEQLSIDVSGRFQSNDGDAVRRLALAGEGVVYKSEIDVIADLNTGALVRLCPDWETEESPLFMMCADRRILRPLVRGLWTHLLQHFQKLSTSCPRIDGR
ncbi:LysR family transcriptional regulator [Roseateles aquatilis]|uniref:LysR family transcriptional regulator n=1 Tax=Roseateles aquatilis TaxID=431061 RepID=A0A246J385_9BURK|nr:LysR family transcriptional regulator [Roseateles aquatilis]OWQ86912.1 LysR family transcriptional regulator [Roseateles aquatilis]